MLKIFNMRIVWGAEQEFKKKSVLKGESPVFFFLLKKIQL